jgi:hypothetical protein
MFIVGAPDWRSLGQYAALGRTFYSLFFLNRRKQQQPSYCHILLLIAFLKETLIRNIIITICIKDNNAVIDNNLWKSPRPYFAPQNPNWYTKGFFVWKFTDNLGARPQKFPPTWRMQIPIIF